MTTDVTERRAIVDAVRAFLDGSISFKELGARVPEDPDDEDIAELLDLVEHLPARGGLLGVRERAYRDYMAQIEAAVRRVLAPENARQ